MINNAIEEFKTKFENSNFEKDIIGNIEKKELSKFFQSKKDVSINEKYENKK